MDSDNLKAHGGVGDELPLGANYLLILFFSFFMFVCMHLKMHQCMHLKMHQQAECCEFLSFCMGTPLPSHTTTTTSPAALLYFER